MTYSKQYLNAAIFLWHLIPLTVQNSFELQRCHSCASLTYLNVWNQLMQVYFPPMNFTDRCWDPVFDMGSVHCSTACFTMVETIAQNFREHAVLRGCIDRFLLFGLDEDVQNAITIRNGCWIADPLGLNLKPLNPHNNRVTVCSCRSGSYCNNENRDDLIQVTSTSNHLTYPICLILTLLYNVLSKN